MRHLSTFGFSASKLVLGHFKINLLTYYMLSNYNRYLILIMQWKNKLTAVVATTILTALLHSYFMLNEEGRARSHFDKWCKQFNKLYNTDTQQIYRYQIFKNNKQKVENHNKLAQEGKYKYFMGLNQYADMTQTQFKYSYGHVYINEKPKESNLNITLKCAGAISDAPNPPETVNWTDKAVDKTVRSEGKCAANWAFSAVGAVEGLYALKQQKLLKLSDQQLIDCSGEYGNEGCGGGFMEQAFWYIIDHGMANEKSYPYVGAHQNCKYTPSQRVVQLGKCAKVPSKIYQKLLSAVVQQPVTVTVASEKFMLYERGIYDGQCTTELDRGLLLVGYGTESDEHYWLLKNSLGVAWGEKGYIRLKRITEDGPGLCGIQLLASIPQDTS